MKWCYSLLLIVLICAGCASKKDIDARWAKDRGAGTELKGKTVIYTVFVDTKSTHQWTGFDIQTTKDSLEKVSRWMEEQAKKNDQELEIQNVYYKTASKTTFVKNLPYDHIYEAFGDGGYEKGSKLNRWVTGILKKINKTIKLPGGKKLPKKPKLAAEEQIVRKLRTIHGVQNVTINIMVNNFFVSDASAIFNSMTDEETEFIITSGKETYTIASLILSAYGAQSLLESDLNMYKVKNIQIAQEDFPNDIMVRHSNNLNELEINDYTAYLIGWKDYIDTKYVDLFMIKPKKDLGKKKY